MLVEKGWGWLAAGLLGATAGTEGSGFGDGHGDGIGRPQTAFALGIAAAIAILEPHNVVFAEVGPTLHLDHFDRNLAWVD